VNGRALCAASFASPAAARRELEQCSVSRRARPFGGTGPGARSTTLQRREYATALAVQATRAQPQTYVIDAVTGWISWAGHGPRIGRLRGVPARRRPWLLVALVASSPRGALAQQPAPVTLEWSAPSGCSSQTHILEQVAAILGRSAVPRAALAVHAVAERGPGGKWTVNMIVDRPGESGRRHFEAESCEAAADATALIVALTIDPTRTGLANPPARSPAPGTPEGCPRRCAPGPRRDDGSAFRAPGRDSGCGTRRASPSNGPVTSI